MRLETRDLKRWRSACLFSGILCCCFFFSIVKTKWDFQASAPLCGENSGFCLLVAVMWNSPLGPVVLPGEMGGLCLHLFPWTPSHFRRDAPVVYSFWVQWFFLQFSWIIDHGADGPPPPPPRACCNVMREMSRRALAVWYFTWTLMLKSVSEWESTPCHCEWRERMNMSQELLSFKETSNKWGYFFFFFFFALHRLPYSPWNEAFLYQMRQSGTTFSLFLCLPSLFLPLTLQGRTCRRSMEPLLVFSSLLLGFCPHDSTENCSVAHRPLPHSSTENVKLSWLELPGKSPAGYQNYRVQFSVYVCEYSSDSNRLLFLSLLVITASSLFYSQSM